MPRPTPWPSSNRELLERRLCDLDVQIEGSPLEGAIARLHRELADRQLRVRPHCWLSEEWFSPEGVPGIGIPFYLAHPRLRRLERSQCGEVEGGTQAECLRLLRHEAGHAVQHAFGLQRRKRWRALFGSSATPYPDFYRPHPARRHSVIHLPFWYAQSHPDEDFAETFAVWLTPRSAWRVTYQGWPALRKLEYVDELMAELANAAPPVRSRARPDPLHRIQTTLGEHYAAKKKRYRVVASSAYDTELRQLFPSNRRSQGKSSAPANRFLKAHRQEIEACVAEASGRDALSVKSVLEAVRIRSRELGLRTPSMNQRAAADFATRLAGRSAAFFDRKLDRHAL